MILLWMRKQEPRKGEGFTQGHTARWSSLGRWRGVFGNHPLVRQKFCGWVGRTVWVPASGT